MSFPCSSFNANIVSTQDLFALYSQEKASMAIKSGVFEKEIVPVTVTNKRTTATVEVSTEIILMRSLLELI